MVGFSNSGRLVYGDQTGDTCVASGTGTMAACSLGDDPDSSSALFAANNNAFSAAPVVEGSVPGSGFGFFRFDPKFIAT